MSNKSKKFRSKFFRVAVEGATTDGRKIERSWIEQMAATYNADTYGSRVWVEHIRSLLPDSPFRAYGSVLAAKAEEVTVNGEKKLALFVQIDPTDDLVNMVNVQKQKLYTSVEVQENFAGTGKAYLMGVAVTDTPASLGTEMLAFAAQNPDASPLKARKTNPDTLFSAAELVDIELDEVAPAAPPARSFSDRIKGMFKPATPAPPPADEDDESLQRFASLLTDMDEQMVSQQGELVALTARLAESERANQGLRAEFASLKSTVEKTPEFSTQRPPVTGPAGAELTDC
jgi:hypothetical protein